jgi:hypothetical protein
VIRSPPLWPQVKHLRRKWWRPQTRKWVFVLPLQLPLAAVLVGLAIGFYLRVRYSAIEKMHLEQSPDVPAQKARELVVKLGYTDKPADTALGFDYDTNFQSYVEHEAMKSNWDQLLSARPSLLQFWYRQSPDLMSADHYRDFFLPGVVAEDDPPTTLSGMVNLKLDPRGRLITLQVIPPQKFEASVAATTTDWGPLFAAAELDATKLQPVEPQWNSLAVADTRVAWTGLWPGTTRPLRVEAAAWQGRPVFFALVGDWNKPWRMVNAAKSAQEKRNQEAAITTLTALITILLAGLAMARRNYRHGRGDREGAWRLALLMFVLEMVLWLCRTHFVAGFETAGNALFAIASALLVAGLAWMIYMAVEPWIRRRWPQAMISWSRLISGQIRDPLLGRDILFGAAFGALWLVIVQSSFIPLTRMGAAPSLSSGAYLLGGRQALGQWLLQAPMSLLGTLQFFFLLLRLKLLVESVCRLVKVKVARSEWIAAVPFIAIWVVIQAMHSTHPAVEVPRIFLVYLVLVIVLLRFGLVPLAVGVYTVDMLANVPFSADFSAWYATTSLLTLISVVALAGWGFYHSLGGERVWKVEME